MAPGKSLDPSVRTGPKFQAITFQSGSMIDDVLF